MVDRPWLCPEVPLRLVTHACPLWTATEGQLRALGWDDPYWAFAWPGGQALARYVLDHPETVRGRTVLDFGCGGAVEGVAAALSGARRVLASDIDPVAVEAATLNAALSSVTLEVTTRDLVGVDDPSWEVVLAGDMCYSPELTERVLAWLEGLAARGVTVLLGDPGRGYLPEERLSLLATFDAPIDADVRGLHLRRTVVGRLLPGR